MNPVNLAVFTWRPRPKSGAKPARAARAACEPPAERRGQRFAQLLKARMHVFSDVHDLIRRGAHLRAKSLEPAACGVLRSATRIVSS